MSQQKRKPKSYAERLDPGGELGKQMSFLQSGLGRLLARAAGTGADLEALAEQYQALITQPDRIAAALAPLGWVLFDSAQTDAYATAAALAEEGRPDDAETLLVKHWNGDNKLLEWPIHRLVGLYGIEDERIRIREARQRLLWKALEYHRNEEYAASVPILVAQVDGIFVDFTGRDSKEFFHPANPELEDEETLAGHPSGLRTLSRLMSRSIKGSAATGDLHRHAIVHGRELGYDTLRNSTKMWAGLFAVIDAMRPRADRLNAELKAAREARLAGSRQVDEHGRLLDRRGFDEAKLAIWDVQTAQFFYHAKTGRYTTDRNDLNRVHRLKSEPMFDVQTTDDAQEYWAWIRTPPGMVFGMAAREGDSTVWFYAAERIPYGGIDSDSEWRHARNDPSPTEW